MRWKEKAVWFFFFKERETKNDYYFCERKKKKKIVVYKSRKQKKKHTRRGIRRDLVWQGLATCRDENKYSNLLLFGLFLFDSFLLTSSSLVSLVSLPPNPYSSSINDGLTLLMASDTNPLFPITTGKWRCPRLVPFFSVVAPFSSSFPIPRLQYAFVLCPFIFSFFCCNRPVVFPEPKGLLRSTSQTTTRSQVSCLI